MRRRATGEFEIHGSVAPGFESVKQTYEREMRTMAETNTQLCVYYKGERVVDLWASLTNDPAFSQDSLVNVFSSGKSLECIAVASLVGRGLLDYDAKIADYWPEFGANGKGELTVADLMRHEGGMAAFDTSLDLEDLLPSNIKKNRVGSVVENQTAKFRTGEGSRREYHALTRGWIVNELFRRVDPEGRTVGEYLRTEVSEPLEADVVIGVEEKDLNRISKVIHIGFLFQFLESLKPKFLGRRIKHSFFQILGRLFRFIPSGRNAPSRGAPSPLVGFDGVGSEGLEIFNQDVFSMGETPSAGAKCSARGLAKVAAMMAAGGSWAGREYLPDEAWKALHSKPVEADIGFGMTLFTQGGVNEFIETNAASPVLARAFNVGREGFFGWMGLGGSIFQWNPRQEIGFAFVPTSLHVIDILNERGKVYQAEVLRCVERLKPS